MRNKNRRHSSLSFLLQAEWALCTIIPVYRYILEGKQKAALFYRICCMQNFREVLGVLLK